MRTASSALYRYFAGYEDLIGALCVDAYESLAEALTAASNSQPDTDPTGQWWAICHGFRRWALEQPSDFALLFSTPVPGYQAPEQLTGPAAGRAITVALAVYAAAVEAGAADPPRTQVPPTLEVGDLLLELLGDAAPNFPAQLAGIALNAFASLRGYLATEIFGSLTRLVEDTDHLYQAHARTVMLGMGFNGDLIEAAAHSEG
jgi:AcrR family transcriptional regulator